MHDTELNSRYEFRVLSICQAAAAHDIAECNSFEATSTHFNTLTRIHTHNCAII